MRARALLILFGLLIAATLGQADSQRARKLYPVDEGPRDRTFVTFRDRLLRAARERDENFITSIVHPQIKNSFGGDDGAAEFKQMWLQDRARREELFSTLTRILSLGGSFQGREFCAPYVFTRWPNSVDSFEHAAITASNVRVRAQANATSPVIATLSYDLVRVDGESYGAEGGDSAWVKIRTPSGRQGYVAREFIWSPVDYRACFAKARGSWRMTMLIAGD
jgi:Bacterial SH3 domain